MTAAFQVSKLTASSAVPLDSAPKLAFPLPEHEGAAAPEITLAAPERAPTRGIGEPPIAGLERPLEPAGKTERMSWPGYAAAGLGHVLLLAGFLAWFGTAGAPLQTSENTIEIEIVLEPPGQPGVQTHAPEQEQPQETPPDEAPVAQTAPVEEKPAEPELSPPEVHEPPPPEMPVADVTPEPPPPPEEPPAEKPEPPPDAEPLTPAPLPPPKPKPETAKPPPVQTAREPAEKTRPKRKPAEQRSAAAQPRGEGGAQGRQAAAGQNATSIDAFKAAVAARLARNRPSTEIAAMAQGVVTVAFGVSASGEAQAPRVVRSSGHAVLDNAALQTVRKASPFPPPPPGAPRSFTVPMRFNAR